MDSVESLQESLAGEKTSQDSPSILYRPRQLDSVGKTYEQNKELDWDKHDPGKGNDGEVVHEREIKGHNQAAELSDYFRTVEERFKYIENEMKSLKAALRSSARLSAQGEESMQPEQWPTSTGNAPGMPDPDRIDRKQIHQEQRPAFTGSAAEILEIKRMGEEDFYLEYPHVLQVMVGDIPSPLRGNMQHNLFEKSTSPQTIPLRLRIRSRPLLGILERMIGNTLLRNDKQQSLVFRYPFKPIITLAHRIRDLSTLMSKQHSEREQKENDKPSIASDQRILGSTEAGTEGNIMESSPGKSELVNDSDAYTVLRSVKALGVTSLWLTFG